MLSNDNIIRFPNIIKKKKKKYLQIRDELELLLSKYAIEKNDLWAVCLAAGRFASMNLQKIDGEEKALEFFKNCIETQKKSNLSSNPSNIS